MNAPMIVVQGDLLLPTLFPLASMPNAIYGEEWTLTGTRPCLTEYEIPFYAARFLTAYVSALSLRNDRFPYTPASLWGKFKRNDEVNQAAQGVDVPPIVVDAAPQAAEPAPFAFEPFTAPDDRHVKAPSANNDHHKQLAGGAIALACAAFIAWALFGTKIGHQDAETHQPKVVLNASPAITPTSDSETTHAAGASSATVVVASAGTSTSPSNGASAAAAAKTATTAAVSVEASVSRSAPAAIGALPSVQKPVVLSCCRAQVAHVAAAGSATSGSERSRTRSVTLKFDLVFDPSLIQATLWQQKRPFRLSCWNGLCHWSTRKSLRTARCLEPRPPRNAFRVPRAGRYRVAACNRAIRRRPRDGIPGAIARPSRTARADNAPLQ
jgi:hypothetical protein